VPFWASRQLGAAVYKNFTWASDNAALLSIPPAEPMSVFFPIPLGRSSSVQQKMNQWARVAALLGSLGVGLGLLTGCGPGSKDPANTTPQDIAQVGVVVLQPQDQALQTTLPGRVRAFQMAEVRPQVGGIIQKQLFTEGALVRQGQALYQIDATLLQANLSSAQAALAKAQASFERQQLQAQRSAQLVKIAAISAQQDEDTQAAARIAQAEVQAARASVQMAQTNLRYARIEAPIAGRISLSNVTPGALVTANQSTALTEVVQIDPMYVDFTQSTAQLLQLQRDWAAGRYEKLDASSMPIALQLEDGSAYPHVGKLQFSGLMVNPSMGTVTLRAVVPNPDGQLLPGMFAQAVLPTGMASGALLIPQQAVTRDATGRASVLVVQDREGQKIAVQRTVQLAQAVGNQWLVESGVQAGDMVVVEGFQRFKPGDRVDPQTMPAQRPAAAAVDPQAAGAALRSALERQP